MFENHPDNLFLFGVGQVALAVATLASQYVLFGTTRDKNKFSTLEKVNIQPILLKSDFSKYLDKAKVLVTFPPDGKSDKIFSSLCTISNTVIYISSTAVYGNYSGIVDEKTPVDEKSPRAKLRLEAEKYWHDKGAIILRAPGLYGPNSGLHLRLKNGTYRLPPQNNNYISRIHLKDLARIILAAFAKPLPAGSIYLVGDKQPATQLEVVEWLCKKMNLPLPPSAAPDEVPISLTANRRINANKILSELNLELEFPTYREGYAICL